MRKFLFPLTAAFFAMTLFTDACAKDVAAAPVPTALQDYVNAPDDSYEWKILDSGYQDECLIYDIELTSQTWQGITWKHALNAFVPDNIRHSETVLLYITGGANGDVPDENDRKQGAQLAKLAQAPVVFLHQVPNQPLLGGKVEDDLITETLLRYLDTKDATWPLLFPMVKSAVRAMDAIQELAEEEHGTEIKNFVVTGGSKRGWTTWLTAVADKRVAGIAPIVIDTLNMPPQMIHQMESWGEYSEQIIDYTSKGLVEVMQNQPEIPLWRWVDPYTYRAQLTLPKLLINGTNDRYWVVDALNQYWDGLVGPKYTLYVPNAGHGLEGGRDKAMATLAVFTQHVAMNKPLPEIKWKHDDDGDRLRLSVDSKPAPKSIRLWVANSETKDFREAKWSVASEWKPEPEQTEHGAFVAQVPRPESGHVAFYAEAIFEFGPISYGLTTQIRRE